MHCLSSAPPTHKISQKTWETYIYRIPPMSQRLRQSFQLARTDRSWQGQLDSYFPGTRGQGQEASKMAPTGKAQKEAKSSQQAAATVRPPKGTASPLSLVPSPGSVSDSAHVPPLLHWMATLRFLTTSVMKTSGAILCPCPLKKI